MTGVQAASLRLEPPVELARVEISAPRAHSRGPGTKSALPAYRRSHPGRGGWRRAGETQQGRGPPRRTIARGFASRETAMHRLTVLYPAKGGEAFNYDYYFNNHHKLVVSRLKPEGMVSCEFDQGVSDPAGGKAPYLAIAYLKFTSADALQKALAKHGAEIVGDIANYTKIELVMQVNEVKAS